jgi:hypothetical protein
MDQPMSVHGRATSMTLRRTLDDAPHAARTHPSAEHFWPLLVAAGGGARAARMAGNRRRRCARRAGDGRGRHRRLRSGIFKAVLQNLAHTPASRARDWYPVLDVSL